MVKKMSGGIIGVSAISAAIALGLGATMGGGYSRRSNQRELPLDPVDEPNLDDRMNDIQASMLSDAMQEVLGPPPTPQQLAVIEASNKRKEASAAALKEKAEAKRARKAERLRLIRERNGIS